MDRTRPLAPQLEDFSLDVSPHRASQDETDF